MRIRTALLGLGCAMAVLIAGCSATLPGNPQLQDNSGSTAVASDNGGDTGGGDGNGDTGSGDTGAINPTALPTDLITSALSELSNIPGVSNDCIAVASAVVAIGLLIASPVLGGQALTQEQVDQAFKGLESAPAELQPAIKTLHDAASQAVGKSGADALAILGSDDVQKALDQLLQLHRQAVRGQLIISATRIPVRRRSRLVVAIGGLAAGLILVVGCSNDTPMPGENGPSATDSPSVTAESPTTSASALPGLTDDCTDAVNAQIAISMLFEGALSGKPLTAAQVSSTFTPLASAVPEALADDVEVLHQAAMSAVGKDQVAVAGILADPKTAAAMNSLNSYVKACTPTTS